MRAKGINYDTGFTPGGRSSRPGFDHDVVRAELRVIARDLKCGAVRITGGDPERLDFAARCAAEEGLEVWFSPFLCELSAEEMLPIFEDCARRAEALRATGARVVLVLGCEISSFSSEFLPGATVFERMATMFNPAAPDAVDPEVLIKRLNEFLARAAAAARQHFGGLLTYAAGAWEEVDWDPFDIVGLDAYRAQHNAPHFAEQMRSLQRYGKPVAATEFGCCTFQGASALGATGWVVADQASEPPRINGGLTRDEGEQAIYLEELLDVFEQEGVDAAFWFTFAGYGYRHDPQDPEHDMDMASYGLVTMQPEGERGSTYPEMEWEPKEAFRAMARLYGR